MKNEELCHCGKPLHYTDDIIRKYIEEIISELGEHVIIELSETEKKYLVPRHYIALHGLKASELDSLGFDEV